MKRWSLVLAAVAVVAAIVPSGGSAAEGDPITLDCYDFVQTDLVPYTGEEPTYDTADDPNKVYPIYHPNNPRCDNSTTRIVDEDGEVQIVDVDVPAGYKASLLHTHANFHSSRTYTVPNAPGIDLQWVDAAGATVQSWACVAAAVSDDYDADALGRLHCQETHAFNAEYAPGLHHLVVDVRQAKNCPAAKGPSFVRRNAGCYYHGRLYLVPADSI